MADNRRAYGLAKQHGIDTTGMSPKEVWDALKEKGVSVEEVDENYSSDGNGGTREASDAEREHLRAHGVSVEEKKMTPAEKIASVHIDFDRDNILPELNEDDLEVLGVDRNKPVLLKKNVIDRNIGKHDDVTPEDSERMIGIALYSTKKEIIPNKDRSKPKYYSFASFVRVSKKDGGDMYGVVMIDVDDTKDAFEIVHWHYVPYDKLGNIKGK